MNVQEKAAKAIAQYTGRKVKARDVQVFADPYVAEVYAIRIDAIGDFLLHGFDPDNVEEVEFTEWPPNVNEKNPRMDWRMH